MSDEQRDYIQKAFNLIILEFSDKVEKTFEDGKHIQVYRCGKIVRVDIK